ncbi:MAG: hypothetical protein KA198_04810 [Chitinophagaceae bacterium]|nr:hypothetical protein [Chitinophagaceae bacterium]
MNDTTEIETLYQQAENFGKTTMKLWKCQAIDTLSDLISSFVVFIVLFIGALFTCLFASVSLAYWLGKCFGNNSIGFILVAGLYFFFTSVIYLGRNRFMKSPFYNALIARLQKK